MLRSPYMRAIGMIVAASLLPAMAGAADIREGELPRVSLMRPGSAMKRGYVWSPNASVEQAGTALPHRRVLYLNRHGGHYVGAEYDNPAGNASYVVLSYGAGAGGNLSAFAWGDGPWTQLMSCVRERYGAFDIEVTDVEPAAGTYLEVAVGGSASELGSPEEYAGQAPMECAPMDIAIAFAYSGVHDPNDLEDLCWTVLQESAHALSLDHEVLCADPMTYDRSCGSRKEFMDMSSACGEDSPRTCSCGSTTQNSVQLLLDALGPSGDLEPPQLSIVRPVNGARVPPGFTVDASAQDDVAVVKVELLIDGVLNATDTSEPWSFVTAVELPLGDHTLEVRASDAKGNMVPQTVAVTVDESAVDGDGDGDGSGNPGAPGLTGGCTVASNHGGSTGLLAVLVVVGCLRLAGRRRARRSSSR